MSLAYRVLYAIGFTPWEEMADHPQIVNQISGLFAAEEQGRDAPYGRALDLGCGSGIWAVELARRGWEVTGVDAVPKALRRAEDRARDARVEVELLEGDVTDLDLSGRYRLLLDFGCFHDDLNEGQRLAEGREASRVAAPGATLLLMAWEPGRRGPLPRGAGLEEIKTAFAGWTLVDQAPMDLPEGAPGYVKRANPRFYRLRFQ